MTAVDARCWVLSAFDVGRAISLSRCREALTLQEVAGARRPEWPHLFGLDQRPLVWSLDPLELSVGGRAVRLAPRVIIYDFGNVSVALGCRLSLPLDELPTAAAALRNASELPAIARRLVTEFMNKVGSAVQVPRVSDDIGVYTVFQLDQVDSDAASEWLNRHRLLLAQTLRADTARLADEEVAEVMAKRLSYAVGDAVVIDGSSALVIDREFDDTLAVLDFANCERLSMQVLDDELDGAVAQANQFVRSRFQRWKAMVAPGGRALNRLSQLTFDAAAEFEAVENAIKLTGDHYLARVYRLVVDRFDLRLFHEGISRKLATLWSIQHVVLDQASTRRSEVLELIIIALIMVEVLDALR